VPVNQGEILWARCLDPQGANEKLRPLVVISRSGDIANGEPIVGVAITTSIPHPMPDDYINLPWHAEGRVRTKLRRPSAASCRWLVTVNQDDCVEVRGHVAGALLVEIIDKTAKLHSLDC
jgi:hypothetical protein